MWRKSIHESLLGYDLPGLIIITYRYKMETGECVYYVNVRSAAKISKREKTGYDERHSDKAYG
jgi:hypothetical protein